MRRPRQLIGDSSILSPPGPTLQRIHQKQEYGRAEKTGLPLGSDPVSNFHRIHNFQEYDHRVEQAVPTITSMPDVPPLHHIQRFQQQQGLATRTLYVASWRKHAFLHVFARVITIMNNHCEAE